MLLLLPKCAYAKGGPEQFGWGSRHVSAEFVNGVVDPVLRGFGIPLRALIRCVLVEENEDRKCYPVKHLRERIRWLDIFPSLMERQSQQWVRSHSSQN